MSVQFDSSGAGVHLMGRPERDTPKPLPANDVDPVCQGIPCKVINSQLAPRPERDDPTKLAMNAGCAYQGSIVLGMGFTLTPEERDTLVKKNKCNAQRIFPYLGGQEVNTSPTQDFDRYVISFGEMSLEEAEAWPDLLGIVREKVKPERDNNKRAVRKKYWWRFGETTPALYTALAPLSRCLVTTRVTKHLMFAFQPTDRIFNEKLSVFPLDHYAAFAILQSRIHEVWSRLLSSTLETRLNYSASDCFDTFPFPGGSPNNRDVTLEGAGQALYDERAAVMRECQIGLTKLYNDLPVRLQELHLDMDRAVLDAYGWSDLHVPSWGEQDRGWELEVVERLYELNQRRSATCEISNT